MESFLLLLGRNGLMLLLGIGIFAFTYHYSKNLFQWIEDQTAGTRDYIMKQLDFMHIQIEERYIMYMLLFISFGTSFLFFAMVSFLGHWGVGLFIAPIIFLIGWKLPRPFIDYLVEKRIKEYQGQLVDGLTLLANGLRAGLSVPQSLGMVVDEMPAPISQEFNLILQENRMGIPLEECFENLVKRINIEDNQMFVTSMNILRETGGNLPEVFDTICSVIRERVRLQQKIDTYTAQSKTQGIIIFCMPFALGAVLSASDPESMKPLFTTAIGWAFLAFALILDVSGGLLMIKLTKIRV